MQDLSSLFCNKLSAVTALQLKVLNLVAIYIIPFYQQTNKQKKKKQKKKKRRFFEFEAKQKLTEFLNSVRVVDQKQATAYSDLTYLIWRKISLSTYYKSIIY